MNCPRPRGTSVPEVRVDNPILEIIVEEAYGGEVGRGGCAGAADKDLPVCVDGGGAGALGDLWDTYPECCGAPGYGFEVIREFGDSIGGGKPDVSKVALAVGSIKSVTCAGAAPPDDRDFNRVIG